MNPDILATSAAEQGRQIESGRLDPRELTEAYLAKAETHPCRDRIFTMLLPVRARAEADAAAKRAKTGLRRSPLDGVAISWKDLFDTAGYPTEAGSLLLKGRVPGADAVVLQNAARAGLVTLGKTHMTELAFSGLGINPVTATPPNINDPALAPGGSSSGAAASVAFGLASAAIGSDTGGSIRGPAAWNNLTGLKPTHGRLSLTGVVPLCPSFDVPGPLTRSVGDAALLACILACEKLPDLTPTALNGRRFIIASNVVFDDIREAPLTGFEAAVDQLAKAGASIETSAFPEFEQAMVLTGARFIAEAWATWHEAIEANPGVMFAPIRERFRSGAAYSAAQHIDARNAFERLSRSFWQAAAGADGILMPTSPILPPNAARLLSDPDYFTTEGFLALRNTRMTNLLGGCALTLPTGTPACGLMVMAAPGQDVALARLGISMAETMI